jgi:DNA N-6-adenine-methyltransferase (Dam).
MIDALNPSEALSIDELDTLARCEIAIQRGLKTFVEVGEALLTIREGRLYRSAHRTFEDYCQVRWGMQRAHAYRLMDASAVVSNLSPMGDIPLPTSERQLRPLTSLTPEQQRQAWQEAVETASDGKVTAAHVERVASQYADEPVSQTHPYYSSPEFVEAACSHCGVVSPRWTPIDAGYWRCAACGEKTADAEMEARTKDDLTLGRRVASQIAGSLSAKPAAAEAKRPPANFSSESYEWYTPAVYVEAAREVLGEIDLDPASCPQAQQIVKAGWYYTSVEDGLKQAWHGRVWLNPPYGTDENRDSNAGKWCAHLIAQYEAGKVEAAILLVNAVTERAWFQQLWAYPLCFTDHRIQFYTAEGQPKQPTHGNVFAYLGPDFKRFRQVFNQFGVIVPEVYARVEPV